jgi:hypothetical protein
MYSGEGATPWLPLAWALGGGALTSILWWRPGFLFRCPRAWRRPYWQRLAFLRPLCWWGRSPLHCLLAPLLSRIEHEGARVLLRCFFFRPTYYGLTALPGRALWALVCLGALGPLLRLVGGDWTLPSSSPGPGVMVVFNVHVAPLHVPWWRLHTLWVLDSRRQ